jgi:hypothetical protein
VTALAAALLLAQLQLQEPRMLAAASNMSGEVQAAGCQGHLLVVWREETAIIGSIDGKRVQIAGTARGTPAVACGRASWLVVWPSESFGVDGRRVAFEGSLLLPTVLFRGPFGASEVAAGYGVDQFLVAWTDGVTVRTLRVSDDGGAIGAPAAVNLNGVFAGPRIVWTGTSFFLAWAEDRANPLSPKPTRIWGTRVAATGAIEPVSLPLIEAGAGMQGLQPSVAAENERLTFAWVAEHGAQTCVDVAQPGATVRSVRCSDDDAVPVLDAAEVHYSRGELVLVWRELKRDFTSALYAMSLDDATPVLLAQRAWGAGVARTDAGVAVAYFATFPPPNEGSVAVFVRTIEQDEPPARRRAVRR